MADLRARLRPWSWDGQHRGLVTVRMLYLMFVRLAELGHILHCRQGTECGGPDDRRGRFFAEQAAQRKGHLAENVGAGGGV